MENPTADVRFFVSVGRVFGALAFLALLGAWLSQAIGGSVMGMSQQHLFNDAIALALLGILCLVDALLHQKNL
jgi:hypothetical protein